MFGLMTRNLVRLGMVGGLLLGAASLAGQPAVELVRDAVSGTYGWLRGATVGYDAAACRTDPVPCLRAEGGKLEVTHQRIETALGQIRPAQESVQGIIRTQETKAAQADLFLAEGRRLLQAATDPKAPIAFIGATYPDSEALTRQLRVIYGERQQLQSFLTSAHTQVQALRDREEQLLVARGSVKAQLAMIPAQIELARTTGLLSQFEGTLRGIDAAVSGGEQHVAGLDSLMRTTDELMHSQATAPAKGNADDAAFDAFIKQHG